MAMRAWPPFEFGHYLNFHTLFEFAAIDDFVMWETTENVLLSHLTKRRETDVNRYLYTQGSSILCLNLLHFLPFNTFLKTLKWH